MSRTKLSVTLLAATAIVAAAVTLATGTLSKANKAGRLAGPSPACLPASLQHSAKLDGLPVYVSPAPQTDSASPYTQISFLGAPAAEIRAISVVGRRSGIHLGRLRGYSQGDGASFLPNSPFQAGEHVTVHAEIGGGTPRRVAFSFRIDTPYSTARIAAFPNPTVTPTDYQSFATLPGVQAPRMSVTVPDRDPAAGEIFMTNGPGPGRYGPLIYTPQGRLVWFEQLSGGLSAENLSVQSYDGQPHLTFWQGKVLSLGFGQGEDVVLDSHYEPVSRVRGGNGLQADLHDFQIAPHHISYTTAFNPIRCDLSPAGGTRNGVMLDTAVQEIDMDTGLVRWEWHSLDHVGVDEAQTEAPRKPSPWDWFHLNSIDVQPGGNLFISARTTWASYQLQAGSGNILWRLGGTKSSFKMGPGTETAWQHDGRILPNGEVTLFDDGSNPPVHHHSRALRLALDFSTHRALLRASYTHPSGLLAASQGNMQTLPDGNVVVGYGGIPQLSEFSKDGALLFDAHLPLEMDSYRGFRFPWRGHPTTPSSLVANLNNTGEETIVRMSWNGASEVSGWRVLAGKRRGSLAVRATVPASDFESAAILPERDSYVKAQALSSSGQVLGTSALVAVGSYAASFPRSPGA